ncbi:MAG: hypothetical protein ACRC6I_21460, partial [Paracoccaceae bacterium]
AGCGGPNPFIGDDTDETPGTVDPTDPNVSVNNQFLFDRARNLTLNRVTYDATANQLVINNLPFDGPAGVYTEVSSSVTNGVTRGVYESQQTPTTGIVKYYAMFVRGDYLEATTAAGRDWGDFGYAGANVNRDVFRFPASGEYVYRGIYGGTRTFSERGGIELVTGNIELLLDVDDLDPSGGIQGAIVGTVTGRVRIAPGSIGGGALPDISLKLVSFNTQTGVWEAGEVETSRPDGTVRDTGTHEGIMGGPNGEELGGYLVMEGVADVQRTSYESIPWTLTVTTPIIINGIDTGATTTSITSGVASGLAQTSTTILQQIVDSGGTIPTFLAADQSAIPPGAVLGATSIIPLQFTTDFNAREVGVYVSDVVVP